MKSSVGPQIARTLEVAFLVLLMLSEIAFICGGWWVWLQHNAGRATAW